MVGPSKTDDKRHSGAPEGPTGCIRCSHCGRQIDIGQRHETCDAKVSKFK